MNPTSGERNTFLRTKNLEMPCDWETWANRLRPNALSVSLTYMKCKMHPHGASALIQHAGRELSIREKHWKYNCIRRKSSLYYKVHWTENSWPESHRHKSLAKGTRKKHHEPARPKAGACQIDLPWLKKWMWPARSPARSHANPLHNLDGAVTQYPEPGSHNHIRHATNHALRCWREMSWQPRRSTTRTKSREVALFIWKRYGTTTNMITNTKRWRMLIRWSGLTTWPPQKHPMHNRTRLHCAGRSGQNDRASSTDQNHPEQLSPIADGRSCKAACHIV